MSGIDFIGPGSDSLTGPLAEQVARVPGLPRPYGHADLIAQHLTAACFFTALELSTFQHVNPKTDERFTCVSYYTDDLKDGAVTSREDFGYLSTMSAPFVRRLAKISHLLAPALALRPRTSSGPQPRNTGRRLQPDPELQALFEGRAEVSEAEALAIISAWPSKTSDTQVELGESALFYDTIRLIWLHEWAHAMCGHVGLAENELGLSALHEFATDRAGESSDDGGFQRNEVLQAIEAHADEFAVRYCINGILYHIDPVAGLAGSKIDLVDRFLIFNVSFCIFAIVWALAERKYCPDDTFYPPSETSKEAGHSGIFVTTRSTHPPALLRYQNFRGFQREMVAPYGVRAGNPQFGTAVDSYSFGFLETLGELSGYFFALQRVTPMIARTPITKVLEAYTDHLVKISGALAPILEELYFIPTVNPYADDNEPPKDGGVR